MKPFNLHKIILLLFVFGISNLYAVQPTTTNQAKEKSTTLILNKKIVKKNPRKSQRKTRLIDRFKEKIAALFPVDKEKENTSQDKNLETRRHGLAIASLVLGIVGIITVRFGVGFVPALLALIFGAISKKKIKRSGGFYTGKGMATAGFILGIIPLGLFLLLFLILLSFGGF